MSMDHLIMNDGVESALNHDEKKKGATPAPELPETWALLASELGESYVREQKTLWDELPQEKKTNCVVYIGQELVHVRLARKVEKGDPLWPQLASYGNNQAYLWMAVTNPSHRNQGWATRMLEALLLTMQAEWKPEIITSFAWEHPDGKCPAGNILAKLGFEVTGVDTLPWKTQCEQTKGFCPQQNPDQPCGCSRRIYQFKP